jgi:hypothetical protein
MGGYKVWASPHGQLDRPVAFPEDGIRGQGKAVGIKTPPTALLFWCGFCLKPMPERRFPPPWSVEDIGAAFVVKDRGYFRPETNPMAAFDRRSMYRASIIPPNKTTNTATSA